MRVTEQAGIPLIDSKESEANLQECCGLPWEGEEVEDPSKTNPEFPLARRSGAESSRRTVGRFVAYFGVLLPFVTALIVLVGWLFDLPRLTTIVPGFAPMQPNTAAGFLLAAISLVLLLRETKARIVPGKVLALLVFSLGLLTTSQYVFGSDFGIDTLLVGVSSGEASNPFSGRMSPLTACCFLAMGVGLFFLRGRKNTKAIAEFAVLAAMLTALLGLMGYAYGMSAFYRIGAYTPMAIHTACAFLALGCGILAARPVGGLACLLSRGTSGSVMARRLLPAALVIPLVLGWLRVKAEQAGYLELPVGSALLVASLLVIFVALIWRTAVSLDRTDLARQRTEDALHESEGRYRSLFESIDEGFCVIQMLFDEDQRPMDYRFLEINPAFERQAGLEGALGKRMRELIPNHDAHWFETYGRVALTGEATRFENYSESLQRWFDVYAFRIGSPEERKVAVLFNNITDRKRAENARQRLAAIVESSEDAIISKDSNGIITTWNAGAERLLGYTAEEAVGQPVMMLIPADHADEEPGIMARIRRGETFKNYETVRRRKDGTRIDVSLTISPIKDNHGRIIGASKIMHDITARKRAERELAEKARLLDLSNDAIIARSLDGNITVWNRGAEKYYGWKAEEVMGKHLHTLLQTELPKPMPEILEQLYREHSFAAEVVQTARDGRRIPLLCRWALDQETGSILTSYTDITERLKAEGELAEKARLLDLTNDAVIVRDTADRIRLWNKGAEKLYGWKAEEVLGKDLHSLLQTEFPKPIEQIKAELHREGKFTGEVVQVGRDGHRIPSLCRWVLDRETDSILTSYTDMSALKRSEASKSAILESALDCIIAMDPEGRVIEWNPASERTFGFTRAQALGKPLADLIIPARFREAHWRGLARFKESGEGPLLGKRIEMPAIRADGSEFPVELSIAVSRAAGLFFTAYLRDITERKKAEADLLESEERFRTLGENIAQLAWMANPDGWIFWYNRRWYEYTGTTFEEMQGWGWEKVHHREHIQSVTEKWKAFLARGEPWEDVFPLRHHSGKYGWFLSRAFPLRDAAGKITRWFGTNTDITELRDTQEELKKAQEELQRHAASLEVTVAERTARLREIIGELEAFSYSLSHDMRAPLRAIQGFTQMALEECGDNAGPYLSKVISAAVRLDRMIQEVLSYTKISRQEIRSERLDVERLVQNIISERPELQTPRAEVIVNTPLLPVRGHEASLTQCLTNLLGNAVKFVPRDRKPRVVISSELRGDAVRLWIEDNGIGIEPEAQRKLFEMFYRVNGDKDYEGTGLGLAIVRKAVERMGGTVGVESEPGRGSRFWVQLPNGE